MIYLDHAATSFPKPVEVVTAMRDFLECAGGNPGRSGHRLSIAAARAIYDTRESLAEFFGIADPLRVIFTQNATQALNTAILGMLQPGQRVVTGGMEHNAVMRPLRALEKKGVVVEVVPAQADGSLRAADFAFALKNSTQLVIVNHASNVTGTIAPMVEIAALAHAAGAPILVDAAQTAGILDIDMTVQGIDLLTFTGHKALQGPPGTGGLIFGERLDPQEISPLVFGGTGSKSEFEVQPDFMPDRFESGTPNGVGIAGLGAGLNWIRERGLVSIRDHELSLTRSLREGLGNIKGIRLFGPEDVNLATGVTSFTLEGKSVSAVGYRLDEEFDILCRVGLHCSPAAHRSIGSFPQGTVRLAVGVGTTLAEIEQVVMAVERIARE